LGNAGKKIQGAKSESWDFRRSSSRFLIIAVAVSLLLHLASIIEISNLSKDQKVKKNFLTTNQKTTIKIKMKELKSDAPSQKIVEVPLEKTEKPKDPKYLSSQDHKAEKETKLKSRPNVVPGMDAGQGGKAADVGKEEKTVEKPRERSVKPKLSVSSAGTTPVAVGKADNNKSKYEKLMPSNNQLAQEMKAGYQQYIDDKIAEGDRIDINTSDYRFIGYFTAMRKSIELVWNYPYEAIRRRMEGKVGVEFTIVKDGTISSVKVISSSGFEVLDTAIVEAIRLAAPFSPLPDGLDKEKLTVVGNFSYILTSYMGG
jgi:periplasmic protein TonB